MGISYTIAFPTDSFWGLRKPDGNWTGVLGMLQRDEADMAININNPTKEAKDVAVETEIIVPIDLVIMAGRLSRHQSNIFGLIQIFSWEVSTHPMHTANITKITVHGSTFPLPAAIVRATMLVHVILRVLPTFHAKETSSFFKTICLSGVSGSIFHGLKLLFILLPQKYKKVTSKVTSKYGVSDLFLYPAEEQHEGKRGDIRTTVNEREMQRWAKTAAEKSTMALCAREKQDIKRVDFLDDNRAAHYTSTPDVGCCELGYIKQNTHMWT
ncbi:unnamed protein product [Ixodes pacificus]